MTCPTCNIQCSYICPNCLESVNSLWHFSKDAKKFKKDMEKSNKKKTKKVHKNADN